MAFSPALENAVNDFTREVRASHLSLFQVQRKSIVGKLETAGVLADYPSDRGEEKYPILKATPQLVEYNEGELKVSGFGHETYTVKNRLFGRVIPIPLTVFEDMGTNAAAKEQWLSHVTGLSIRAFNFKVKMVADMLLGEGLFATAATTQGYDSLSMFSESHAEGSNLLDASGGAATTYTVQDIEAEHDLIMDLATAQTDPDGHDFLREEAPDKWVVLVDPQHLRKYATVFRASTIPYVREGASTSDTGGVGMQANVLSPESDGVMRGIDGTGRDITLIGWSRLRNKTKTFYLDASGQVPGPPALFYQNRVAPQMEVLGVGSEHNTLNEQIIYKVRMRGTMGIGDFNKAFEVRKDGT